MLLALDSSSERLLLGLANREAILGDFTGPPDRNHSERMIVALDRLLTETGFSAGDIDLLAAVTGPGSFTGLRIGIATLLGLAEAWGKEIIGGSTQELHHLLFARRGLEAVTVIHCRGEQFFISTDGTRVETLTAVEITGRYRQRLFAGPGVDKLFRAAPEPLQAAEPPSYSAGELAQLFALNRSRFEILDPADLHINYAVGSQPERLRDEKNQKYVIVEMSERDLDDIVRIETETFTDAWHRESFRRDLRSRWIICLAVRLGRRCIGYADCLAADDYGYLANIAVDKEFRSRGIGKALLQELCRRLQRRHKRRLLLDVRPSNSGAIKFYEREGFAILVRRQNFYVNPGEDSYTMGLDLSD